MRLILACLLMMTAFRALAAPSFCGDLATAPSYDEQPHGGDADLKIDLKNVGLALGVAGKSNIDSATLRWDSSDASDYLFEKKFLENFPWHSEDSGTSYRVCFSGRSSRDGASPKATFLDIDELEVYQDGRSMFTCSRAGVDDKVRCR